MDDFKLHLILVILVLNDHMKVKYFQSILEQLYYSYNILIWRECTYL